MSGSLPLEQLENTLERAIENVRQVLSSFIATAAAL
jgi:hypothetical protein